MYTLNTALYLLSHVPKITLFTHPFSKPAACQGLASPGAGDPTFFKATPLTSQNLLSSVGDRRPKNVNKHVHFLFIVGESMNAVPQYTNDAAEFPTFGEIAGVSASGVQWISHAWENHLCDHDLSPAR